MRKNLWIVRAADNGIKLAAWFFRQRPNPPANIGEALGNEVVAHEVDDFIVSMIGAGLTDEETATVAVVMKAVFAVTLRTLYGPLVYAADCAGSNM